MHRCVGHREHAGLNQQRRPFAEASRYTEKQDSTEKDLLCACGKCTLCKHGAAWRCLLAADQRKANKDSQDSRDVHGNAALLRPKHVRQWLQADRFSQTSSDRNEHSETRQ